MIVGLVLIGTGPRVNNMPKFQHDCKGCQYLLTGKCPILGEGEFDFYICPGPTGRSIIARYGSECHEYVSGVLFGCVELTALDKVALFARLKLEPEEEKRLLGVFARMWRSKLTIEDYRELNIYADNIYGTTVYGEDFGPGNVVFDKEST